MTTIPGHNQMIQQSGVAQEASQQSQSPKPSPDQAAGVRQAEEVLVNSTVQDTEESDRLKEKKEQEQRRRRRQLAAEKKKRREKSEEELAVDLDATGRILDTTA